MGWTADQFWTATAHELFIGLDGFGLAQGSTEAIAEDRKEAFSDFLEGLEAAGW